MLDYDFDNSVGYWVYLTSQSIRRSLERQLQCEGITIRQFEVLACLALEGGLAQAELADRLGIEAPTLAGVLRRMERDGWLERRGCSEDRRKKRVHPTSKAEAVWQRMAACGERVRTQATLGITDKELATLKSVCERLRHNVDSTDCEAQSA